jgi:hypothetical protein
MSDIESAALIVLGGMLVAALVLTWVNRRPGEGDEWYEPYEGDDQR